MIVARLGRRALVAIFTMAFLGGIVASAVGAQSDPLWVFTPVPKVVPGEPVEPPPRGSLYGPCGMGVDSAGNFYVSDGYHNVIDKYEPNANYAAVDPRPTGATGYLGQIAGSDSSDGPCGLAFDASDTLYANVYHRSVVRFGGGATLIAGQGVDESHPTGVDVDPATGNVYVDERTYIAVYDSTGVPVLDGSDPLRIAVGSLEDGYGVAFSRYPGTAGRLYVPDAATGTIKVYEPAVDKVDPVDTIDGSATQPGKFVSLRDSAIAVDRATGEIYVADDLQPVDTERPRALIDVFEPDGAYEGHLKFMTIDAKPVGLAVDNSPSLRHPIGTQGRVYLTSGNTEGASIYAYPPGAATTTPVVLPTVQLGATTLQPQVEPTAGQGPVVGPGLEAPAATAGAQGPATPSSAQPRKLRQHRRGRHHRPYRSRSSAPGKRRTAG